MAWTISYIADAKTYAPLQSGKLTNIKFTNKSGKRMIVTRELLKFDWMGTYRFVQECNINVAVGETIDLPDIIFTVDIGVCLGSHNYKPGVSYKLLEDDKWIPYEEVYVKRGEFIEIQRLPIKDFRVFVSHSNASTDTSLVKACKDAMKTCGLTCYFAEDDSRPGIKLWDKIAREIILSDAFLVLWTKGAAKSGDVREEIGIATGAQKHDRIVPLVEAGIEVSGSLKSRGIEWVNYDPPNHTKALSEALAALMEWAKEKETKKVRRERAHSKKKKTNLSEPS